VIVFGIAFGLFVLLPVVISLKKPILAGRYWMIGAPGLIVVLAFLARSWQRDMVVRGIASWPALLLLGAIVLAFSSGIYGFIKSHELVASKPVWKGAEIAGPLLRECPPGSVHVGMEKITEGSAFIPYFAMMSKAPTDVFVDAGSQATGEMRVSAARCPVLGWAEHVLAGDFVSKATDAELLAILKIEGAPEEVFVERHVSGFILLQRP